MIPFLMLGIILYFITGTVLARRDYASRVLVAGEQNVGAEIDAKETALKKIRHDPNCWRGPKYHSKTEACDCSYRHRWAELRREIRTLESEGIVVDGPYRMLFCWPALAYDSFLKSGSVKQRAQALRSKEWEELMEAENLGLSGAPGVGELPGRHDS